MKVRKGIPFTEALAWLLDIDRPIDVSNREWKKRQAQLRALPRWSREPTPAVRRIFEWARADKTDQERQEIPATDEELRQLKDHIRDDPVAYIWHFASYRNRDNNRRETATPTDGQLVILWRFAQLVASGVPVRIALLKVRQGGFSWLFVNLCGWLIFFHKMFDGLSAAQDVETTKRTFRYLKDSYDLLPPSLRPEQQHSTRTELILRKTVKKGEVGDLGQESSLVCQTAGRDNLGTGFPLQLCHFSETGKWDDVCDTEQTATSVAGSIQEVPWTFIFDESTAKGRGSYWHKKYTRAKLHGQPDWNGFTAVFIPWFFDARNVARPTDQDTEESLSSDPNSIFGDERTLRARYDLTLEQMWWRRNKIRALPDGGRPARELFAQEFPSNDEEAWLMAGGSWLAPEEVGEMAKMLLHDEQRGALALKWKGRLTPNRVLGPRVRWGDNRVFVRDAVGELEVYRLPDARYDHIIGGDVAGNTEKGDRSTARVYRRVDVDGPMRLCAIWRGWADEDDYADVLWRLGFLYGTAMGTELLPALLAWERTGIGASVSKFIRPKTPSVATTYPESRMFSDRPMGTKSDHRAGNKFGVSTNQASKPIMLGLWKSAARKGQIQLDTKLLSEAASLEVQDSADRVKTKGKDDFMASVMAVYAASLVPAVAAQPEEKKAEHPMHSVARDLQQLDDSRRSDDEDDY